MRRCLLIFALTIVGLGVTACGTIRGVGEDVQDAGRVIKRAAS